MRGGEILHTFREAKSTTMRVPSLPRRRSAGISSIVNRLILTCIVSPMLLHSSCAQSAVKEKTLFAGSTPCDALIKQMAGIPQNKDCEFMKWEVLIAGD